MDAEKTIVVFRRFRNSDDLIALFPGIDEGNGLCSCYQTIGQHGTAAYHGLVGGIYGTTVPAHPGEIGKLKAELEGLGYNLDVRQKWQPSRTRRST